MTRAAAAGWLVLLASGVASASSTPMVTPPAGWRADAERASGLAKAVADTTPLGDPGATVAAELYTPPTGGEITLLVTRVTSRNAHLDRGAAAAAAIDDVRGAIARAKLSDAKPIEDSWAKGVSPADVTLEASLAWHDPEAGTRDLVRIVIAADAASLVAVTGECLSGGEIAPAAVAACKAALGSLEPGIARADRVVIPPPAEGPRASGLGHPETSSDRPDGSDGSDVSGGPRPEARGPVADVPLAHMSDGSRVTLPPMAIPQDAQPDHRPVYVGAGIAILALAFYWNRRNRERFLPEEEKPDDR